MNTKKITIETQTHCVSILGDLLDAPMTKVQRNPLYKKIKLLSDELLVGGFKLKVLKFYTSEYEIDKLRSVLKVIRIAKLMAEIKGKSDCGKRKRLSGGSIDIFEGADKKLKFELGILGMSYTEVQIEEAKLFAHHGWSYNHKRCSICGRSDCRGAH